MVQHETLPRMEDGTRGLKQRKSTLPSLTQCVTRMQKLQGSSPLSRQAFPGNSSLQSWGGRLRESPYGKGVITSVGRDAVVGRCIERPVGEANKDQGARSRLKRSPLPKNDDTLQLPVGTGPRESEGNGCELSPAGSPIHSRPVHLLPRRPRAATLPSCSSDPLSPCASPISLSDLSRNGIRKEKSIDALCSIMQKQGGRFDYSPVLTRVRHRGDTTRAGLPSIIGVSPVVYRKKHASPYNTSMAKRQLDFSYSPGIDSWVSRRPQRHSNPLPLPTLQASSNSQKSSSTKQHQKKAASQTAKNSVSLKRPSSARSRSDKIPSDAGSHTQMCVKVTLAPPSSSTNSCSQSRASHDVGVTAQDSSLPVPAITFRAATPCPFDNEHMGGEEDCQNEGEPSLTERFAIRAELAEVLRKLSQDVQDIVHATNSLDKRD